MNTVSQPYTVSYFRSVTRQERSQRNVIYGLHLVGDEEIRYVGMTTQPLSTRFYHHKWRAMNQDNSNDHNVAAHRWIRKYGPERISAVVIEVVDDPIRLVEREVFWIDGLGTFRDTRGLNLTAGGEGARGYRHTEATKAGFRARVVSDATRKKMSASRLGISPSPKAVQAARDRCGSRSHRSTVDEATVIEIKRKLWSGVPASLVAVEFNKSKSFISHINTDRKWRSVPWPIGPRCRPGTSELMSTMRTGLRHSEETRKQMSKSATELWARRKAAKNQHDHAD